MAEGPSPPSSEKEKEREITLYLGQTDRLSCSRNDQWYCSMRGI
jgi:hypothetical protein